MHSVRCLTLLAFVSVTGASAQESRPVEPGTRLRVTRTAVAEPVVGTFASWEAEQLILDIGEGGRLTVPLDQLRVSFMPQGDGRFALGLSVAF